MEKIKITRSNFQKIIDEKVKDFGEHSVQFYQSWKDNLVDGSNDEILFLMFLDYENDRIMHDFKFVRLK